MTSAIRSTLLFAAVIAVAGATALGGCAYRQPATQAATVHPSERAAVYQEGRYELMGDGTAASPYYWVWIPNTVAALPAPPPVVGAAPTQRVVTYAQGRYELGGDGSASAPYYWVWVPAGTPTAMLPPPPPLPR